MATTSLGLKLGRAVGTIGAYAVEGAVRGFHHAGQFGEDVVTGADVAYTEVGARLVASREEAYAKADAARAAHAKAHTAKMAAPASGKRAAAAG
jgi:hypothetical protein